MADIIHRIGITSGPDKVYWALSTIEVLAAWWTADTSGVADVGTTISFQFCNPNGKTVGGFDMEVLKHEPFKRVQWECVKGPKNGSGRTLPSTCSMRTTSRSCCSAIGTGRNLAVC